MSTGLYEAMRFAGAARTGARDWLPDAGETATVGDVSAACTPMVETL
jgi:hypothetical protein